MTPVDQVLTTICAVGAGTTAGAFFTFSTFTMAGLKRLAPARGAAAMQAINEEAPSAPFMLLLFGTGAACLVAHHRPARGGCPADGLATGVDEVRRAGRTGG